MPNEIAICKTPPRKSAAVSQQSRSSSAVTLMFNNYWTRKLVFDRRLDLKGTDVFISDDLTQEQASLLFQCRQIRTHGYLTSCWSVINRIMLKRTSD